MEKRYPGDFITVRPWGNVGDRKNDGYLRSKRMLFQSYAPNDISAAECVAKIDDDFLGALPFWQKYFGAWISWALSAGETDVGRPSDGAYRHDDDLQDLRAVDSGRRRRRRLTDGV
jgi:hypothetical protein